MKSRNDNTDSCDVNSPTANAALVGTVAGLGEAALVLAALVADVDAVALACQGNKKHNIKSLKNLDDLKHSPLWQPNIPRDLSKAFFKKQLCTKAP